MMRMSKRWQKISKFLNPEWFFQRSTNRFYILQNTHFAYKQALLQSNTVKSIHLQKTILKFNVFKSNDLNE